MTFQRFSFIYSFWTMVSLTMCFVISNPFCRATYQLELIHFTFLNVLTQFWFWWGGEHYLQGDDPQELHLPSKEKHSIPIPVTAQTANSVGFTKKCSECGKARLIYAERVLSKEEKERFLRWCFHVADRIKKWRQSRDMQILQSRRNCTVATIFPAVAILRFHNYSAGYPNICIFVGEEDI